MLRDPSQQTFDAFTKEKALSGWQHTKRKRQEKKILILKNIYSSLILFCTVWAWHSSWGPITKSFCIRKWVLFPCWCLIQPTYYKGEVQNDIISIWNLEHWFFFFNLETSARIKLLTKRVITPYKFLRTRSAWYCLVSIPTVYWYLNIVLTCVLQIIIQRK